MPYKAFSLIINRVDPDCDYVYDSIYRLKQAKGREHIANNSAPDAYDSATPPTLLTEATAISCSNTHNATHYDAAGNMILINNVNSWGRTFTYSNTNNQLLTAPTNNEPGTPFSYLVRYSMAT